MSSPRILTSLLLSSALLIGCSADERSTTTNPTDTAASATPTTDPAANEATETDPTAPEATTTDMPVTTQPTTEPTSLPAPPDGELVGQEPTAAPSGVTATAVTLTYRIEGAAGAPVEATATLLTPVGDTPTAGWPLMVWAPGGTGLADACATGASPDLFGQAAFLAPVVAAGVAVVVPNYEGLAVPGDGTYRDSESLAHATLGAARAAFAVSGISQRYALAGYSLGGQAALAAAEHANDWAPDLTLVEVLSVAPAPWAADVQTSHFDAQIAAALAAGDTVKASTLMASKTALLSYLIAGLSVRHPELQLVDSVGSNVAALASQVTERCTVDLIVAVIGDISAFTAAGGTVADYPGVLPGWFDEPAMKAALAANRYGNAAIDAPVVVVHGTGDQIVPNVATLATVDALNAVGNDITYVNTTALDHFGQLTAPETATARDQLVQVLLGTV